MTTPTYRSSARLRDKRLTVPSPQTTTSTGQARSRRGKGPTATQLNQASTPTSGSSSRKRQKIHHEMAEYSDPKTSAMSRPDGRVRGKRGQLKLMTEMPMDVLYEIFASLEPIDLLHMSWASKTLNAIIMSKSARFLWERGFECLYARSQAPPACPSDLNLAQYTKLLFDKRCVECNSPHGSHVSWVHRLRVCSKCLQGNRFTILTSPYRYWRVIQMMRTFVNGRYQTYVLASEHKEVTAKMESTNADSDEWKEYEKKREDWMAIRRQDDWKFAQWQRNQKRDRKNELEDVREKRRDIIVAKLSELGWREELDHLNNNQLWTLPGVRIAKPLTDKAWETLCPELIEHLEAVKELRLEREKRDRIARRCENLANQITRWSRKQPQSGTLPKILDIALTEPFKSFILSDSDEESTFVTDQEELEGALRSFADDWNESRNQFLASLLPDAGDKLNTKGKAKAAPNSAVLNLATTFFQCPSCPEPISYPRILAHECQLQSCTANNRRDTDPEDLTNFLNGIFTRPWFCESQELTFDQEVSDIARMIVQECGENPDEASPERMDEKDCRLECTRCSEPKRGRWVMKWRMAILHELEKHAAPSKEVPSSSSRKGKRKAKETSDVPKWRLVTDPGDLSLVLSKEAESLSGRLTMECRRCRYTVAADLPAMETHWSLFHSYPETERNRVPLFSLASTTSEKLPLPQEDELRAMFEVPLDRSIKSSHITVKIPMSRTPRLMV